MIICPICQNPIDSALVGDFYCMTKIERSLPFWTHFNKFSTSQEHGIYYARVPPFEIAWFSEFNHIIVKRFFKRDEKTFYEEFSAIYDVSFEGFIDTVKRFQNLKAFS